SMDDLIGFMPAYTESLKGVENETALAAEETDKLAGRTRNAADAMESYLSSIGLTADELAEWQLVASEASASFVSLTDAYDGVITKNMDVAKAAADATKSSKDSWEDFYDGTSVSIDDFIAKLEEQVAAQEAWEANMLALS